MQTATAVATIIIAVIVAWISLQQWKVNREKFRLELYSRRFEIYTAVLNYLRAVNSSAGIESARPSDDTFLKAYSEAVFLFPDESGLVPLLTQFDQRADEILAYFDLRRDGGLAGIDGRTNKVYADAYKQNHEWMDDFVLKLQETVAPYLNFHGYKEQNNRYQFWW